MVLPSAPMAQPNQQYPTLWSQFGVSQATQQQDKLRQDKRYPDTVSSASSTDEDMIRYGAWHPDEQQQNQIRPVCGQRHEYQLGCTRHKILMDKSVEPRNVDYTISEWAKTRPIYSQANDQGTSFRPEVPEQKEAKYKYTVDEEKQQDNHLIAQRSTEEFLKEINENEWLRKYTIEACTTFLKKQFPNKIKGLSEPVKELKTPTPSTTSNEVPRGQVLFDEDHWTLSLSTKPNEVFYIDSGIDPLSKGKTKRELSSNLINQIKQSHKVPYQGSLKVSWLDVQQQENNFDCGVFVIAFLVEFFFDPRIERLRSIAFETSQNQMRRHLSECFKKREFSPFPKRKEYLTTPGIPGNLPYVILP